MMKTKCPRPPQGKKRLVARQDAIDPNIDIAPGEPLGRAQNHDVDRPAMIQIVSAVQPNARWSIGYPR